jgi:pimeloyl-ACP methyl ester carboxylesterase
MRSQDTTPSGNRVEHASADAPDRPSDVQPVDSQQSEVQSGDPSARDVRSGDVQSGSTRTTTDEPTGEALREHIAEAPHQPQKWVARFGKWITAHARGIAIGVLLVLLIAAVLALRIGYLFFTGDELKTSLIADNPTFTISNTENASAHITLAVKTPYTCTAVCEWSVRGPGGVMEERTLRLDNGAQFSTDLTLVPERIGEGISLYSVSASCMNEQTFWCPTNQADISKTLLLQVSYGLPNDTQAKRAVLQDRLIALLATHQDSASVLRWARTALETAPQLRADALLSSLQRATAASADAEVLLSEARQLWATQDYNALSDALYQINESAAEHIERDVRDALKMHNQTMLLAQAVTEETRMTLARHAWLHADPDVKQEIMFTQDVLQNITLTLETGSYQSYDDILERLGSLHSDTLLMAQSTEPGSPSLSTILERRSTIVQEAMSALCNCTTNMTSEDGLADVATLNATLHSTLNTTLNATLNAMSNATLNSMSNETLDSTLRITAVNGSGSPAEILMPQRVLSMCLSLHEDVAQYESMLAAALAAATNPANGNASETNGSAGSPDMDEAAVRVADLLASEPAALLDGEYVQLRTFSARYCDVPAMLRFTQAVQATRFNLSNLVIAPPGPVPPPREPEALPEQQVVCCVFDQCRPCCEGAACKSAEQYPVMLVHGHAFSGSTSPEYSAGGFLAEIQRRLQDDGYLDIGTVTPGTPPVREGLWGLAGRPVVARASYYYNAYRDESSFVLVTQKSESIDTYAIRMKEIVDRLRHNTGQDKIHFVAYSMGGLVVRRYIQIFGDEHVASVTTIGSPHAGVGQRVTSLCPVLGEQKECDDMREGSVFLRKLNDPQFTIDAPFMAVVGHGCDTDGGDGDGVVKASSATPTSTMASDLRIVNINGTCTDFFGTELHGTILDTELYPAVYGAITENIARAR